MAWSRPGGTPEPLMPTAFPLQITTTSEDAGKRLDQFLAAKLGEVSRARVQELICGRKNSRKRRTRETFPETPRRRAHHHRSAPAARPPLRAIAEDIPLDILYEDDDLAIINKPAGMMVHAGAGATEDATQSRHAGQRAAASFRQPVGRRRRDASRHRPPPRQRNQRPHRRRQERRGPSQTGRPVRQPRSEEDLCRASPRMAEERQRNHLRQHQPRPRSPHSHDHAPARRARGCLALPGPPPPRHALRQVHPASK